MKTKRLFAFDLPVGKAMNSSCNESLVQPSSPTLYDVALNRMAFRSLKAKRLSAFDLSVQRALHPSFCMYTTSFVQPFTEATSPERSRSSSSVEENWCIETIVSGEEESKDGLPSEQQVPEAVTARRQKVFMMLHFLFSVIVVACISRDRQSRDSNVRFEPQPNGQLKHDLTKEPFAYLEDEIDVDGIQPQHISAVDTISLGECPSDAKVNLEDLSVIVAACVAWERRYTALFIERQLVGKIQHVMMKEPSAYFEEEINLDDIHHHKFLALVAVSLRKYASDTQARLKGLQFLTVNAVISVAERIRKASFKLKKQARDTAAAQKFNISKTWSLGRHVNDIAVAKKSQIKHAFRKFVKHVLKVRKRVNVTTTVRKSQLKQAFEKLADYALKTRKQVGRCRSPKVVRRGTAESFATYVQNVVDQPGKKCK